MDIVLAMLASSAAEKIEERKWAKFPYNIQKSLEFTQVEQNFALYRYLVNNAIRYPREWLDNGYVASVVASIVICSQDVSLKNINILHKTDGLSETTIFSEVEKTLYRARYDFPNTSSNIELKIPIEWKSMKTFKQA